MCGLCFVHLGLRHEHTFSGFGGWHMGNQSQDEVFLAAQEAVGAHRDSQGKIYDSNYLDAFTSLQIVNQTLHTFYYFLSCSYRQNSNVFGLLFAKRFRGLRTCNVFGKTGYTLMISVSDLI